jgi:hypothetical protein
MTEILKTTLPALLVLITAYLLIHNMLRNEKHRRDNELKQKIAPETIKIRLQAYERLALLLERTSPASMIVGMIEPGMTNLDLQKALLGNIRKEFAHNIAQQIYVSNELWNAVKIVQESLLKLINSSSAQLETGASGTELAENIINVYSSTSKTPTEYAMEMLKKEVRELI